MKPTKHEFTGLSLADVSALTIAATCDLFANRVKTASKAFLDQGKLVHHLRNSKLKPGQTVYGLLQAKGVSEGSIQSAVTVADMIDAVVISGHLAEDRFDECITFRTARMSRQLFQGKAKSGLKLEGAAIAALMLSGTTAAVGAELDCLCEHGVTIAERETAQAEQAAQADADRKAAAALAEIQKTEAAAKVKQDAADAKAKAKADAEAAKTPDAPANITPMTPITPISEENGNDENEGNDEAPEPEFTPATPLVEKITAALDELDAAHAATPEPEPEDEEDEAPAPVVIDGTKGKPNPPAPPAGPTLASITDELNTTLVKAFDLKADELEALVHFLRAATNDIAASLNSLKQVA